MKSFLALVCLSVLGVGALAEAQTATPSSIGSTKGASKSATRTVSGTVKSSSQDMVVVVGRHQGKDAEWTFAVEPTTNIRKGGKSIVASDLKSGDVVQVRFSEQAGKPLATSIRVKEAAAPKKPKS